jgi:hypothetical protein
VLQQCRPTGSRRCCRGRIRKHSHILLLLIYPLLRRYGGVGVCVSLGRRSISSSSRRSRLYLRNSSHGSTVLVRFRFERDSRHDVVLVIVEEEERLDVGINQISNEAMNEGRKECITILLDTTNGSGSIVVVVVVVEMRTMKTKHEQRRRRRGALLSPAVTHSTSIIYVTVDRRTARIPPLRSSTLVDRDSTGRASGEAAILFRLP